MAHKLGTIWELEPHTAAKHAILRRYLQAWIPILSSAHGRIVYLDGFAGPGVYKGGEDGSPIIALKEALAHRDRLHGEVVFMFVEADSARAQNLDGAISQLTLPGNFRVVRHVEMCNDAISRLLDELDSKNRALAPTFAFLDPFGFSHTPLVMIQRLMSHARCEVLITFMYEEINRFLSHPEQPAHFDALFGSPTWRQALTALPGAPRKAALRDLYRNQLEQFAGIRYVRSFEMINRSNQTDYIMFFGTNSVEGLKKMKEAMWRVDKTGAFAFSDATDQNQIVLFEKDTDSLWLKQRIQERFRGSWCTISEIEEFVLVHTPYRETHIRKQILVPMEKSGELEVDSSTRVKPHSYPLGTRLRLM